MSGALKRAGRSDNRGKYLRHVRRLLSRNADEAHAMHLAVGGDFEAMGQIERDLLIHAGLQRDASVIDVGCGSGRLAVPLSGYLDGAYLGTDVVPALLDYARRATGRGDWRFELSDGLTIPAADAAADMVCFFSVFTHLRHEESFAYLREAKRVLRPGGRIVFSFLEFAIPSHWSVFEKDVAEMGVDKPVNQFLSRDGVRAFADHLALEIVEFLDGDTANIPLSQPVTLEAGQHFDTVGRLGQSVAILRVAG